MECLAIKWPVVLLLEYLKSRISIEGGTFYELQEDEWESGQLCRVQAVLFAQCIPHRGRQRSLYRFFTE